MIIINVECKYDIEYERKKNVDIAEIIWIDD